MPFGQHQGKELNEIPRSYLRWVRRQPWVGAWLHRGIDDFLGDRAGWPDEEGPEILSAFSVISSGGVGREIVDPNGEVIAWTTDSWVAQVICKLLNENENLLYTKENRNETHN